MSSACAVFHACLWLMCQQTLVRLIVGCVCACVGGIVWLSVLRTHRLRLFYDGQLYSQDRMRSIPRSRR